MLWILGAPAILIGLLVAGVLWMTAVPGRSHTGPLPPLTPDQVQLWRYGCRNMRGQLPAGRTT
jgi:hypothetical protein